MPVSNPERACTRVTDVGVCTLQFARLRIWAHDRLSTTVTDIKSTLENVCCKRILCHGSLEFGRRVLDRLFWQLQHRC